MALVEREHVGGTCINEGCTPTKTMVSSGRVAYVGARATEFGIHAGRPSVDMVAVRDRTRAVVHAFRTNVQARIEHTPGVELFSGTASFVGPDGPGESRGYPKLVQPSRVAQNRSAERLWRISEQLTGVSYDLHAPAAA